MLPGATIGPSMSIPLPSIAIPCEIVPWSTPGARRARASRSRCCSGRASTPARRSGSSRRAPRRRSRPTRSRPRWCSTLRSRPRRRNRQRRERSWSLRMRERVGRMRILRSMHIGTPNGRHRFREVGRTLRGSPEAPSPRAGYRSSRKERVPDTTGSAAQRYPGERPKKPPGRADSPAPRSFQRIQSCFSTLLSARRGWQVAAASPGPGTLLTTRAGASALSAHHVGCGVRVSSHVWRRSRRPPTSVDGGEAPGIEYRVEGRARPGAPSDGSTAAVPSTSSTTSSSGRIPAATSGCTRCAARFKRVVAGMPIFMTEATGPARSRSRATAPGTSSRSTCSRAGDRRARAPVPGGDGQRRLHASAASRASATCCSASAASSSTSFTASQGHEGVVWLHGYGNVFEKVLEPGEQIDVEPGGWVYRDASVHMEPEMYGLKTGSSAAPATSSSTASPGPAAWAFSRCTSTCRRPPEPPSGKSCRGRDCRARGGSRSLWARLDSNQGPRDYESPALTAELRAHCQRNRAWPPITRREGWIANR